MIEGHLSVNSRSLTWTDCSRSQRNCQSFENNSGLIYKCRQIINMLPSLWMSVSISTTQGDSTPADCILLIFPQNEGSNRCDVFVTVNISFIRIRLDIVANLTPFSHRLISDWLRYRPTLTLRTLFAVGGKNKKGCLFPHLYRSCDVPIPLTAFILVLLPLQLHCLNANW